MMSNRYSKKCRKDDQGFTLPELMVATLIFSLTFLGIFLTCLRCMELNGIARNSSTALNAAKSRIATIENTAFNQIAATYNNATFTTADLNGIGVSYVNTVSADFLTVTVVFCWREKSGRTIGEDSDLDGQLDAGEDLNNNGTLDSPIELTMAIYAT